MTAATGSPDGSRKAWNRKIFTTFGAIRTRASGTKRLQRSSAPTTTSVPLISLNI